MKLTLFNAMLCVLYACAARVEAKAPPVPATTGRLHLVFTERSPLSAADELLRRTDGKAFGWPPPSQEKIASGEYNIADETFDVFVPPNYKPDVPQGVFVWIGVTEASPQWMEVLARHRLIFLAANTPGAREGVLRLRLPLDGVHNLKKIYNIDDKRVYVAGFSAGAGMATYMLTAYPDVFHGGFFMMGGTFYYSYKNARGVFEPTTVPMTPQWKAPIEQIKSETSLVLMRGGGDKTHDPDDDRVLQYEPLLLDGFQRVSYLVVPRAGHTHPNGSWFEQGINALDRSKPKALPTTAPTSQPNPSPGQVAQARRLLATAQWHGGSGSAGRNQARTCLQQILADYSTTPSAATARELLKKLDQPATRAAER